MDGSSVDTTYYETRLRIYHEPLSIPAGFVWIELAVTTVSPTSTYNNETKRIIRISELCVLWFSVFDSIFVQAERFLEYSYILII